MAEFEVPEEGGGDADSLGKLFLGQAGDLADVVEGVDFGQKAGGPFALLPRWAYFLDRFRSGRCTLEA